MVYVGVFPLNAAAVSGAQWQLLISAVDTQTSTPIASMLVHVLALSAGILYSPGFSGALALRQPTSFCAWPVRLPATNPWLHGTWCQ